MDIAATASETANYRGLLISPQAVAVHTTDKTDVKFRGVLQDPEVLSLSTTLKKPASSITVMRTETLIWI